MSDTWGIPGPVFLVLFIVLFALAWSVAPLAMRALDRRVARTDGDGPVPGATVEDLALVADGPGRVVQAAIARLLDAGVLRVSRDRRLATTGRPPVGALDEDVVGAVESLPVPRPLGVVGRVKDSRGIRDAVAAAQRRGLLHDPAAVRRRRTLGLLVLGAVVVLGLARLAAGIARGASVGFLVVLVIIAAVLTLFAVAATLSSDGRRPTRRGRATLSAALTMAMSPSDAFRRAPTGAPGPTDAPAPGRAGGTVLAGALGVAGLVAVGGFAMYPDEEVAGLLASPMSGGGSGGSDSGSSCSSSSCSSSSCGGGGGCGGGGCGG